MVKGPVDRHGARCVVGHRDHLVNLQGIEYRVQFPLLLFGGVRVVRRLVRCSPAQKVEGDDLAITQIRDQAIVDVQVIGKTVHEDECGTRPGIVACIDRRGSTQDSVLGV
jgi:hypothetical protein